jgi:hypothetical protein
MKQESRLYGSAVWHLLHHLLVAPHGCSILLPFLSFKLLLQPSPAACPPAPVCRSPSVAASGRSRVPRASESSASHCAWSSWYATIACSTSISGWQSLGRMSHHPLVRHTNTSRVRISERNMFGTKSLEKSRLKTRCFAFDSYSASLGDR